MSTTRELHHPELLAGTLIATPLLFFALIWLVGPFVYFASHLFVAWSVAAVCCFFAFGVDYKFMQQFTTSERLAILAGNGLVALLVAATGFTAFAA